MAPTSLWWPNTALGVCRSPPRPCAEPMTPTQAAPPSHPPVPSPRHRGRCPNPAEPGALTSVARMWRSLGGSVPCDAWLTQKMTPLPPQGPTDAQWGSRERSGPRPPGRTGHGRGASQAWVCKAVKLPNVTLLARAHPPFPEDKYVHKCFRAHTLQRYLNQTLLGPHGAV